MRHIIRFLLSLLVLVIACGGDPPDSDRVSVTGAELQSAGDHGITLMLPFPAGQTRVITRSYETPPTHLRHGAMEWDDSDAIDFAGEGCGITWGTPVLAAAAGTVVDYPLPTSAALRSHLEQSYGDQQVFIDHGNGCYSHYGHLDHRIVVPGQHVRQGEQIGVVGNKGFVQSQCTDPKGHAGSHLHFKMICGGDAIVPEPLSGYRDLGDKAGYKLSHRALHHPVGTLVKLANAPEIYLVCAAGKLCHVSDETVWRSYRFWQDPSNEWATVVVIDDDELACHDRGPELGQTVQLEATTCPDSGAQSTFVGYDDGVTKWRRRVPFAASAPEYAILLRSWGFRVSDVIANGRSCAIPIIANDDRLPLRDGTVIEMSSDDDFYVISDDGIAYRLYRNLMSVLYGNGWPEVIQVPDGSVPSLVRGMNHAHLEFTVTDVTTCANGHMALNPAKNADGTGGGESDGDALGTGSAVSCSPGCTPGARRCTGGNPAVCVSDSSGCGVWSVGSCNDGFACNDASTQCERVVSTPPSNDGGTTTGDGSNDGGTIPPDPPRTLRCTDGANGVTVRVTGPVLDTLVAQPASPTLVEYGSDTDGWSVPYAPSKKASAPWSGDSSVYVIALPAAIDGFNLYVVDAVDASRDSWFDLVDANGDGRRWSVVGDCHVDGTKIVRGSAPPASDGGTSSSDGGTSTSPTVSCMDSGGTLQVHVSGISASALVDAGAITDVDLTFVSVGGDGGLSWTPSATAQPQAAFVANGASYILNLPVDVTRFNLWVWSAKDGRAYWLDLSKTSATGTCRVADDGLGGKVLLH